MNQTQVIINNDFVSVYALFYINNNNYYAIYTDGEVDENDFIVLHIAKILQEVVNTENGPQPTGYLIGTTINNDDEYNLVKQDISNIIESKQNNVSANVQFVDSSILGQVKIRDTKIFRLKKNIFEQIFGEINLPVLNNVADDNQTVDAKPNNPNDDMSFEQKYYQELEKNKNLQNQLDNIIKELSNIKNALL